MSLAPTALCIYDARASGCDTGRDVLFALLHLVERRLSTPGLGAYCDLELLLRHFRYPPISTVDRVNSQPFILISYTYTICKRLSLVCLVKEPLAVIILLVTTILHDVFIAFWVFLPAGAANVAPIFVAKMPLFKRFSAPIDGGIMYKGQRLLGANKTWRGMVAGIILAIAVLALQQASVATMPWLQSVVSDTVDYGQISVLIVGTLFAIGALGGDAIESFFKRRIGIQSGQSWIPFDQVDYIIGGALAVAPFILLSVWQYIWLLVVWTLIHLVSAYIGWLTGLKDKPI